MSVLASGLCRVMPAVALLALATSASAMQWDVQSSYRGVFDRRVVGTFFFDGVRFSDWDIQTPFSQDYVGFQYTSANSRIDMVADDFIVLGLNYGANPCQPFTGSPPFGTSSYCLRISLPQVFDGSSLPGSFSEYRVTYGGYTEGRSYMVNYAPVPEPASMAMLLAGLGLVAWAARRRGADRR